MNYQVEMENLIAGLDHVPKLLLHSCCGPCSTTCISTLTEFFDITVLYYNPNIEPKAEYEKRKAEQIKFINNFKAVHKLDILDIDYDNEAFKKIAKGYEEEKEGGMRCSRCFRLRMLKTAEVAIENDYEYFGTTLTVSPHKNSKIINEIGEEISKELGIKFLYSDFKKNDGYKKSIMMSKEFDLYRQDYCGCSYGIKYK